MAGKVSVGHPFVARPEKDRNTPHCPKYLKLPQGITIGKEVL
jgi:hypothetical protein